MEFRIARAARVTGEMLQRLVLEEMQTEGVADRDCVICYGAGYSGTKPSLNAACSSMDKMAQGIALAEALPEEALAIVPIRGTVPGSLTFTLPVLARRRRHTQGRDIRLCRTIAGVNAVLRNGRHDFFTPVVQSDTEYRAWVYRKRTLCVYEKRLTEPELNTRFGRNRANGWTFHGLDSESIPESVRRVAVQAVAALGLDFGAVDILGRWNEGHRDVYPTVLEVNSAPGVSDEHRTAIVKMKHRIVRWIANGCPGREA